MPEVLSGRTPIHYGTAGDGPPLLLLMGFRLSAAAWPPPFLERLARRFTVITPDNRGTGRSGKPASGYALGSMAADARAVLDALGVERAHLFGFSMGGAIAQEFAIRFPGRVDRLVLFATFCGGRRFVRASPEALRLLRDVAGKRPEDAARQVWPVTYTAGYLRDHRDRAEEQLRREVAWSTPAYAATLQYQAIDDFDSYDRLPSIAAPTLVVTGDRDQIVLPVNSGTLAARIPGARLHTLPGLGHRAFWEAPEEAADLVAAFLAGDSPR